MSHETFSLSKYNQFLRQNQKEIAAFKANQQRAFEEERARWEAAGQAVATVDPSDAGTNNEGPTEVPAGWSAVFAEVPGNMWKVDAQRGQRVSAGDRLAIIESMKMEIPVVSPAAGIVADVFCAEGRVVGAGQILFSLQPLP